MADRSTDQEAGGSAGPLAGRLVIDLSRALAGPHAAMMLGDMGVRVVNVEAPTGDDSRGWDHPSSTRTTGSRLRRPTLLANRNKESLVLDLKTRPDHEVLAALVQRADVLIENFRPGVLDRLGFGTS